MSPLGSDVSGMVFCRGCGGEIHSTAPLCPKCGAPQLLDQADRRNNGFGGSIALCFNRYVQFSGRAPRAEYWYFVLFTELIGGGAGLVDAVWLGGPIFSTIVDLAVFLPALSVSVRRLHDLDRSGWWCSLILVPVVGWVILFIWSVSRGTRGTNSFGSNPLAA
jgi:uncharacterized membrane protein YhaH (DUF805 family)